MESWKSGGEKSQRGEEKKRKDQRGGRVRCAKRYERLKIAHRCGAKHISKSKCTKHTIAIPFLEVEMSKKCRQL